MEQIKVLQKMTDAADLLAMIDEILSTRASSLTGASLAGIRVSVRNAREALLQGHDTLAAQAMNRVRVEHPIEVSASSPSASDVAPERRRKELRSMLEKFSE